MAAPLTILGYSDLEGVYDSPGRVARLAGWLDAHRDDATLVCGAGDDSALGVAATVSHNDGATLPVAGGRRLALPFFDAVAPDAETFGNHDLDHGPAAARALVEQSRTPWLCGNLADGDDPFGTDAGVTATRVVETAAGTVGLFGVTTEELPRITPNAGDLTVHDPVRTARRLAGDLRDRVDHVVGLSHCGADDPAVAAAVDADIVLGGHRHERHGAVHDGTLLVRTGGQGVVRATTDGDFEFHHPESGSAPADRDLLETYARVRRSLALDEVVTRRAAPFDRDDGVLTRRDCSLGHVCADAYRMATDADVGLMHTGSLRSGPPVSGPVTVADVVSLSPFGNRLTTLSVSGSALRAALADLCPTGGSERWFLGLSGGEVVWDPAAEAFASVRIGGEPLRADGSYTVATQEYLVDYDGTRTFTAEAVREYHGLQYDTLVEYARQGGLAQLPDGRVRVARE